MGLHQPKKKNNYLTKQVLGTIQLHENVVLVRRFKKFEAFNLVKDSENYC